MVIEEANSKKKDKSGDYKSLKSLFSREQILYINY